MSKKEFITNHHKTILNKISPYFILLNQKWEILDHGHQTPYKVFVNSIIKNI